MFRTLSIDIWQLKCQQRQKKCQTFFSANFSELLNFSSLSLWEKPLWNQKLLLLTSIGRRSCYTLVRPFPMWSYFPFFPKLFGTNFQHQNENNFVETISCFAYQLSKKTKYCVPLLCVWTLKILYTNKRILT